MTRWQVGAACAALGVCLPGLAASDVAKFRRLNAEQFEASYKVVSKALLEDPSGGEFREVDVDLPDLSGWTERVRCSGWVNSSRTRVVCWDGLAYKPAVVGQKLDLDSYVAAAPSYAHMVFPPVGYLLSSVRTPTGAAMLRLAGRRDLADSLVRNGSNLALYLGPALLAGTANRRLIRATEERACGHDAEALAQVRPLRKNLAGCAKLLSAQAKETESLGMRAAEKLPSRELVARIESDCERRLRHPFAPDAESNARSDRLARLIRFLPEVAGITSTGAGHPSLYTRDEHYKELVKLGQEALPALRRLSQTDHRLSRAYRMSADGTGYPEPVPVSEIAELAIAEIEAGANR